MNSRLRPACRHGLVAGAWRRVAGGRGRRRWLRGGDRGARLDPKPQVLNLFVLEFAAGRHLQPSGVFDHLQKKTVRRFIGGDQLARLAPILNGVPDAVGRREIDARRRALSRYDRQRNWPPESAGSVSRKNRSGPASAPTACRCSREKPRKQSVCSSWIFGMLVYPTSEARGRQLTNSECFIDNDDCAASRIWLDSRVAPVYSSNLVRQGIRATRRRANQFREVISVSMKLRCLLFTALFCGLLTAQMTVTGTISGNCRRSVGASRSRMPRSR